MFRFLTVLNMKECHDKYMLYARDLLHETQSRLDHMGKLSREIRYLANQIQPSEASQESNMAGVRSRGRARRTSGSSHEESRSRNSIGCVIPSSNFRKGLLVGQDSSTKGIAKGGKENISQSSKSPDAPTINVKTEPQKIYQRETVTRNQRQFNMEKNGVASAAMHPPKSSPKASKEPTASKNNENSCMKCLKLCVVLPECDTAATEDPDGRAFQCTGHPTTKSPAVRMTIRRKQISRDYLRIPRVVIQSSAAESYFCDIRLPKIMENFPPPLQMTASKFRLPALRNKTTQERAWQL